MEDVTGTTEAAPATTDAPATETPAAKPAKEKEPSFSRTLSDAAGNRVRITGLGRKGGDWRLSVRLHTTQVTPEGKNITKAGPSTKHADEGAAKAEADRVVAAFVAKGWSEGRVNARVPDFTLDSIPAASKAPAGAAKPKGK